jgi:hypothetical protein
VPIATKAESKAAQMIVSRIGPAGILDLNVALAAQVGADAEYPALIPSPNGFLSGQTTSPGHEN